ncbi:MAG: DUF2493 domain-containing protein [Pikeienuella sp.]
MRVLVCGSRDFTNTEVVYRFLSREHKRLRFDVVIEGDARGVDRMAGFWARKNNIDNLKFRADWKAHGRAAGPIRNQRMLDEGKPDLLIAFPGGRGTADMIRRAKEAGVEVLAAE